MKPVAENLSADFGVLELLQTANSVDGQIAELHRQLASSADVPAVLVGYSWGAWLGFLFAARYPDLVRKLILVSAGAFESKYNKDLTSIRLNRLRPADREEAERLISIITTGNPDCEAFRRFGELMTIADSFDCLPGSDYPVDLNADIYESVWAEASRLRETNELIENAARINCPVVAIHGDYDPHPVEGVKNPLFGRLENFRMVVINKCGHTPWRERLAKDTFFEILWQEIKEVL
ncbi:MAG TPA: alpha/beta hydrolase [Bacteroidales bacterium]|nr:alpha/beta hydrolase [Bacteroidales bacterium]HPT01286.1 alpha/beta hydrolase [Bacteroidales bacterium]